MEKVAGVEKHTLLVSFFERVVARAALLLLSLTTSAIAQDSEWSVDGVKAVLLADGPKRLLTIVEQENLPRNMHIGSHVFEGIRQKNRYEGIFYYHHGQCSRHPIAVSGVVAKDDRSVRLKGNAPTFDDQCKIIGREFRSFEFRWLGSRTRPETTSNDDGGEEQVSDQYFAFSDVRAFFIDPKRFERYVLDFQPDGTIIGDIVSAQRIEKVGHVEGKLFGPYRLELILSRTQDPHLSTKAKYVMIVDAYDGFGDRAVNVKTRLQLLEENSVAPASLQLCGGSCGSLVFAPNPIYYLTGRISWQSTNFFRMEQGLVCIAASAKKPIEVLEALRSKGVSGALEEDRGCSFNDVEGIAIKVPIGAERRAIEMARGIPGIEEADFFYSTAGGSGAVRWPLPAGTFIADAYKSDDYGPESEVWKNGACKLRNTFARSFRSVTVASCADKKGLCFKVTLEGHTDDSTGFTNEELDRKVLSGYLVRSKMEFMAMPAPARKSPKGYIEKLIYYVEGSQYARMPKDADATKVQFHPLEYYGVGIDGAEGDGLVLQVIQPMVAGSLFKCEREGRK